MHWSFFEMCRVSGAARGAARALSILLPGMVAIPIMTGSPALAQVPGEVTNLRWCVGSKDCLAWDTTAGASEYRLYRGKQDGFVSLMNGGVNSCLEGSYAQPTTGPTVGGEPARGEMFWFIATAMNGVGEGSAGDASSGPRNVNAPGPCQPACVADGAYCSDRTDCCSDYCLGNYCQATCTPMGVYCSVNAECCSNYCFDGYCENVVCTFDGGPCSMNEECCNGFCGGGVCQHPACLPSGSPCSPFGSECCSGSCYNGQCY